MEVADDGSGFQTDAREGVGIRGMRARVRELGGTFELLSGPSLGSSVLAAIPLNRSNLAKAVS